MTIIHKQTEEGYSKIFPCKYTEEAPGVCYDKDPGLAIKKYSMSFVPASYYSGKLRMLVQAAYGSKRTDFGVDGLDYRLILDGVTLYHGYSSSHGVYTDHENNYWLVYVTLNGTSIRRIKTKCLDDQIFEDTDTDEEHRVKEAFQLSTAKFGDEVNIISNGKPTNSAGQPIDYGWHFKWDGSIASSVLIRAHPDWEPAPSLAYTWWQSAVFTWTILDREAEGEIAPEFDTDEEYLQWRFEATYTQEDWTDFSMHASDLVWSRRVEDGLMGIEDYGWSCSCLPYPCVGHDCTDAPLYCFYNADDALVKIVYTKSNQGSSTIGETGGNMSRLANSHCGEGCHLYWRRETSTTKWLREIKVLVDGVETVTYSFEVGGTERYEWDWAKNTSINSSYADPCTLDGGWRYSTSTPFSLCGGASWGSGCGQYWYYPFPCKAFFAHWNVNKWDTLALTLIVPWGDCSAVYIGSSFSSNVSPTSQSSYYIHGFTCNTTTSCNPGAYAQTMKAKKQYYSSACECDPSCLCACNGQYNYISCCGQPKAGCTAPNYNKTNFTYEGQWNRCMHDWSTYGTYTCNEPNTIEGPWSKVWYEIWRQVSTQYSSAALSASASETNVTLVGTHDIIEVHSAQNSSGGLMDPNVSGSAFECLETGISGAGDSFGAARWTDGWDRIFAPGTAVCLGEMPDGPRMEVWQSINGNMQYIVNPAYDEEVVGYDTVDWESRFVGWD